MFIHRRRGWETARKSGDAGAVRPRPACRDGGVAGLGRAAAAGRARRRRWTRPLSRPGGRSRRRPIATTYNNYYEFGEDKSISRAAQRFEVTPWSIEFAGMVEKPRTMDLADLLKQVQVQDRVYRHRCVEAWAHDGALDRLSHGRAAEGRAAHRHRPSSSCSSRRAIRAPCRACATASTLALRRGHARMQEAQNDLAFMVTGMYGHELPKQDGAPLRVHLPWKYGFKSGKAIVKVTSPTSSRRRCGTPSSHRNTGSGPT